jgi:hypothetical protein
MNKIQNVIKMCIVCAMWMSSGNVFAYTDLSGQSVVINSNTTWGISGSPYVVDYVYIDNGAVLTIEPGVIVKFTFTGADGVAKIMVENGSIVANSTVQDSIVFTSYSDDVGGDTNGDGNLSEPAMYDWNGISFSGANSPAVVPSLFNNVDIRYSEYGLKINEGTLSNIDFLYNNMALFLFSDEIITINNLDFISNGVDLKISGNRELALSGYTFDTSEVAVVIQDNVHFNCDECNFLGGEIGIIVGGDSDLTLTDSLIENYTSAGIFNQSISPTFSPEPGDNEINISNSEIRNNDIGIEFGGDGYGAIVNNSIHDNDTFGVKFSDYDSPATVDLRNNWWGHDSGPHEVVGNPSGQGDNLEVQFIPYSPWTGQLSPMTLHQYKMDGEFELSEGDTNMSDKFVFKAKGSLVASQRKIEVEIKPYAQSFDGLTTHLSDFQSNTDELSVDVSPVVKGSYKWRARIVDSGGSVGNWIEFGSTQSGVDFIAKPIPHYTQNQSEYPTFEDTFEWSQFSYANGRGDYSDPVTGKKGCGKNIGACGCALSSAVMVLRYYDIINMNGENVDPLHLNNWLNVNNGYGHRGDVDWYKVAVYSGNQVKFAERTEGIDNTKLDQYLNQNRPAIAYMNKTRKQPNSKGGGHFVVIGNKLDNTYEIRDPANYDTYTLNDQPQVNKKIRTYFNGYDGLRFFQPSSGVAQNYTKIHMASPADILITDTLGRRVGKNPLTGESFQEIPNSIYLSESIGNVEAEDYELDDHEWKTAYIPNLGNNYDLDVFGTGDGSYRLDIEKVPTTGVEQTFVYEGQVVDDEVQPFSVLSSSSAIHIKDEKLDTTPPLLKLALNGDEGKSWLLEGIDENAPVTKNVDVHSHMFSVEDRYGNTTKIDFDVVPGYRMPAIGKLNLELNHVTINDIEQTIPYTWISYDWSNNGGPGVMFRQVYSSSDAHVVAEYTQATNQTAVTIMNGSTVQNLTFPKLKLIKINISPNGQPSYQL